MKTVKIMLVAFLAIALNVNSDAQGVQSKTTNKTETMKVSGKCNMCKATIEKAAKVEGVSKAEWDTKTKTLALTYDPSKTTVDQVGKKVAASGYDNEKAKADDKAYNALHSCC
ncbi:MAG: cation transporter, partial [Verrucomicrobia bacterium]|nr:cation transporter [Prolixibacteraceae bacterium]